LVGSFGGIKAKYQQMTTPPWNMYPDSLQVLDHWTQVSIEAHFKELVKEAQIANATGKTIEEETSPSGG
tara:strand:+ start:1197 stop:1403 length:207 start_codon:yes stop_codon:yes gene_type:complete